MRPKKKKKTARISIHALREEGDVGYVSRKPVPADFYPRPPRGGRLSNGKLHDVFSVISIHALREEGDPTGRR